MSEGYRPQLADAFALQRYIGANVPPQATYKNDTFSPNNNTTMFATLCIYCNQCMVKFVFSDFAVILFDDSVCLVV